MTAIVVGVFAAVFGFWLLADLAAELAWMWGERRRRLRARRRRGPVGVVPPGRRTR